MIVTQPECVDFVALGVEHAMRMRRIISVACLSLSIIFFYIIINGTIFEKNVTEQKMCMLIFCTTFVRKISRSKKKWAAYNQKCILVFM